MYSISSLDWTARLAGDVDESDGASVGLGPAGEIVYGAGGIIGELVKFSLCPVSGESRDAFDEAKIASGNSGLTDGTND